MRDDHDFVEEGILRLIEKNDKPVGWYAIEHSLAIPPSSFPNGTNVMIFLKGLKEKGLIEETVNEKGRSAYIITTQGRSALDDVVEEEVT